MRTKKERTTKFFRGMNPYYSGSARVFVYSVFRGVLNQVYGILQLKYGYSVYHFLWISGIKYSKLRLFLGIFGGIWGILSIFFRVYWYSTTPPLADPDYCSCFWVGSKTCILNHLFLNQLNGLLPFEGHAIILHCQPNFYRNNQNFRDL